MTVSTLNMISPSLQNIKAEETLIQKPQANEKNEQRAENQNRELIYATAQAEVERAQNTSSVNPTSISDETRQFITSAAGYNSKMQQLEIYVNGMDESNDYEANQIDTMKVLERNQEKDELPADINRASFSVYV